MTIPNIQSNLYGETETIIPALLDNTNSKQHLNEYFKKFLF